MKKVFILHKADIADITKQNNGNPLLERSVELSIVGAYNDRETAEDEMMWRIQNDFYNVWTDILSRHETYRTAEPEFNEWIAERFAGDDEWRFFGGDRTYILKITEKEL